MQTLDVLLAGLRGTLLLACSVGLTACKPECNKPVLIGDRPTGYVKCSDGAINRETALDCELPAVAGGACRGSEHGAQCSTHADCTAKPNGFCMHFDPERGSGCGCVYPCLSDDECGAGEACMCAAIDGGPDVSHCVPAECRSGSDCSSGQCGVTYISGCRNVATLTCRGMGDACHGDRDCNQADCGALADEKSFQCLPEIECKIGRPLTVDDGVRVATIDGVAPTSERAQYWLGVARMEHASVASFARFVHELLRFGAPPQLIADALAAAADEARHAEQTFAIASAYSSAPLGPGGLRVDDLSPTDDPELFVTRLITEGCVGETLGVAELLALLNGDLDPRLRPCLEQITADETRHAALAWRALAWFAPRVDPRVIELAFEQAIRSAEQVDDETVEPVDPRHGRLGSEVKQHVRALAIASVIEPCREQGCPC